jgi:hypothetical protein
MGAQCIPHNHAQSTQSSTITHNCTIAQSKCPFLHNRTIKMPIFAQLHNQISNFAKSNTIIHNQTQPYTIKQNHFLKHF